MCFLGKLVSLLRSLEACGSWEAPEPTSSRRDVPQDWERKGQPQGFEVFFFFLVVFLFFKIVMKLQTSISDEN